MQIHRKVEFGSRFPWLVSGGIFLIFLVAYFALRTTTRHEHTKTEQDELTYLANLTQLCFQQHVEGLKLESLHFSSSDEISHSSKDFAQFSQLIHAAFPAFIAVNQINIGGIIVNVYPEIDNQKALGANLFKHPSEEVRNKLRIAKENKVATYTEPVRLLQGGMGMALYIPQIREGKLLGFVNGVIRYESFLDRCLNNSPAFFKRMNLDFKGQKLLDRESYDNAIILKAPVTFGGLGMDLTLQSIPANFSAISVLAQNVILLLGFGVSVVILWLLRRSEVMQRKAKDNQSAIENLYNQIGSAVFIILDGHVFKPNETTIKLTGYSERELAELDFSKLIHPADREKVVSNYMRRIQGAEDIESAYEMRAVNKQGETLWLHLQTGRISWEGQPATLNIMQDITEVKKLQVQIAEAEKMEIQGLMASGLAHDFNNILTSIGGYSEMLLLDCKESGAEENTLEMLTSIQHQVKSASDLTSQLLGLASGSVKKKEVIDLDLLVKETIQFFSRTHKGLTCTFNSTINNVIVEVDKGQIEQVLINLFVNADNAQLGSGKIATGIEQVVVEDDHNSHINLNKGKYYRIYIEDDGPGIAMELRNKIFQPFYTDNSRSKKGTGLGLASALNISRLHGGDLIVVNPCKLAGARFEFYIPVTSKKLGKRVRRKKEEKLNLNFVAIVDDEESIRVTVTQLLARNNCECIEFSRGEDFLKWIEGVEVLPQAVLLDMVMPELNGAEVFKRLRKLYHALPVLIITGYAEDKHVQEIVVEKHTNIIKKPFSVSELVSNLNRLV
ncbi:MAG: response regulator [bacterium]